PGDEHDRVPIHFELLVIEPGLVCRSHDGRLLGRLVVISILLVILISSVFSLFRAHASAAVLPRYTRSIRSRFSPNTRSHRLSFIPSTPVSGLAGPFSLPRSSLISRSRCLRISQRNIRKPPAGPGQRDLAYANVIKSVRRSSTGVKKMYSRQRTLHCASSFGSAHQWS